MAAETGEVDTSDCERYEGSWVLAETNIMGALERNFMIMHTSSLCWVNIMGVIESGEERGGWGSVRSWDGV